MTVATIPHVVIDDKGDFDTVEVDELGVSVLVLDLVVAKIFVLVDGLNGHSVV